MPNYSYTCIKCSRYVEINLSMDSRNEPQKCKCGGDLKRSIDAPSLGGFDNLGRSK